MSSLTAPSVTVDTTTISSITPSWGTHLNATEDNNDGTVTVATSGVEDGQTVTIALNSKSYTGDISSNSVAITIQGSDLRDLSEGTHTITANVSDAAGNAATESSVTFVYDKTAPTISSITPSWGTHLNATEDNNDGTVTVATSGVEDGQTVTIALNSKSYTGDISSNSVAITIQGSDLRDLSEGTHTITANVSDAAGNAATQSSVTFVYDKTSPTISSITPSWGTHLNSTEDNNDGTVTVATSGVEDGQTVTIALNSKSYTGNISSNSVAITIQGSDLRDLSEGTHTITANVSDAAGNAATQSSVTFVYDKTAPTISSITPNWGTHLNATEDNNDGTVTVATSGVEDGQTVTLGLNSKTYTGDISSNSVTITIQGSDLRDLSEGTHTITANVSDAAGNAATQSSVTFVYDKTAPTITSTSLDQSISKISVTFNEAVFNTDGGSGDLEASDFTLSISSGDATLSSTTPSSISKSGNTYTLGYSLSGSPAGQVLTVNPSSATAIYDSAGNAASTSQSNNTGTFS